MNEWDAIVVGAGTAGIPAGIFAADRGRRVLVVEKRHEIGGTLHVSGGHMSAAGTRLQRRKGIEDTPDEHYRDIVHLSGGACDPDLTRLAVEEAATTVDWLEDLGFEFDPTCPQPSFGNVHEPYSKPRVHWGVEQGRSQLEVLVPEVNRRVEEGRLHLRLNTAMRELVVEDGAVVGCVIAGPDGEEEVHRAPVVILTSGGYAAEPEYFAKKSGARLVSGGMASSTADGLKAAERLGAEFRNGDLYLPTFGGIEDPAHPHVAIPTGLWPMLIPQQRPPWEIFVNRAGERFVAEDEPDIAIREAAVLDQEEQTFWVVFDQEILEKAPPLIPAIGPDGIERWAEEGELAVRAGSLSDLARSVGMDPDGLEATVASYNEAVAQSSDPLGRIHLPQPLVRPPFYALENHGTTLRTAGGLRIDTRMRVLRPDGSPIPGLHAAGEIIGGATFGGKGYAAGMSVTPALSFGRILGSEVI